MCYWKLVLRAAPAALSALLAVLPFQAAAQPSSCEFNLLDFSGADPTGLADSAPAFRAAVAAVQSCRGGVIIVPPGIYRFTTKDPADPSAHVRIATASLTIRGLTPKEAHWPVITQSIPGAGVFSDSSTLHVFHLSDPPGSDGPTAFRIENLRIDRTAGGATGYGVYVTDDTLDGQLSWIYDFHLENVSLLNHRVGVLSAGGSSGNGVQLTHASFINCFASSNDDSAIFIERYHECIFRRGRYSDNGAGITLGPGGTTYLGDLTFWKNNTNSVFILGNSPSDAARDIHITNCQFDHSRDHGVWIIYARSVNIAACSFTSAGTPPYWPNLLSAGLYLWNTDFVSISGCSFFSNGGPGVVLENSSAVSIAGCTLSHNSNSAPGVSPALRSCGGRSITINGCSFGVQATQQGWVTPQTKGIEISNNCSGGTTSAPFGFYATGLVFDASGVPPLGTPLITTLTGSKGLVRYYDPVAGSEQTVPLP